jgi:hypothetical protein
MGELVFRIEAAANQKSRIEYIRRVAADRWPDAHVLENSASDVVYVTITDFPNSFPSGSLTLIFDEHVFYRECGEVGPSCP